MEYVLDDGDSMLPNLTLRLEPYSDEEFQTCLTWFQAEGILAHGADLREVARLTGKVPRLVTLFAQKENQQTWSHSVIAYYRNRIERVRRKISLPEEEKFLVNFFRFGSTKDGLPDFWRDAGFTVRNMVERDDGVSEELNVPICPAVMDAAMALMSAELPTIIHSMLEYSSSGSLRGSIFEIWVLNRLLSGRAKLPRGHDLRGTWTHEEHQFIEIPSDLSVEHQSVGKLQPVRLKEKTLIVCRERFPVVDFVLALGGVIYFIQVSVSAYADHPSKIKHLHEITVEKGGPTIWKFFTHGTSVVNNSTCSTKDVRYIYITESDVLRTTRLTNDDQHVTLLHKPLIREYLGDWPVDK